jgi:hypothetical protein
MRSADRDWLLAANKESLRLTRAAATILTLPGLGLYLKELPLASRQRQKICS